MEQNGCNFKMLKFLCEEVADSINKTVGRLQQEFPGTKLIVSKLIVREDKGNEGSTRVKNVNSLLTKSKLSCVDNSNILPSHLNGSRLHLNKQGDVKLALNYANHLSKLF